MNRQTILPAVALGALLLTLVQPASACGSTDYQCQAVYKCYTGHWTGWGAVGYCATGAAVCQAWRWGTGESYAIQCNSMGARGDEDDVLAGIFKAGQQVSDSGGKLIEIDQATGEMLQVATGISALQRRGAAIGTDVNKAFTEAGIPVIESVEVQVADDAATGGTTFTLRGESSNEVVMRFDAEGKQVEETPGFSIGDDVKAAMAESGQGGMSARGAGWCAQARPTTGGCAVAASWDVSAIPGARGAPQFATNFTGSAPSMDVFSAAAFAPLTWSVPNAYNALSLVEFFNLGFMRTQSQFDQLLAFCWMPNAAVPGSGVCTMNPQGVCPYDKNAGVTCQSMAGYSQ